MANRNGYNTIYLPSHHRADSTGMVYEHMVIAEGVIGRKLNVSEVVHHIDEVRNNNSPKNLMVFDSEASHVRFHSSYHAVKLENGSYTVYEKFNNCLNCGLQTTIRQEYCSLSCAAKTIGLSRRKVDRPDKETLISELKCSNFKSVGIKYGVSDNTIRKWCVFYGISKKATDYK